MPVEVDLAFRCEPAKAIGSFLGEQEGRLGESILFRNGLHEGIFRPGVYKADSGRITLEEGLREGIDDVLLHLELFTAETAWRASSVALPPSVWRDPRGLLEDCAEVALGAEAEIDGDGKEWLVGVLEETLCLLHLLAPDIGRK